MDLDEIVYIVVGVCAIVVALFIISIVQMKRSRLKPSDWLEHPLGISTGSVRALVVIMIVFITLWVAISNKITVAENMPKWLLAIVGTVIGFYFGNRGLSIEKKKETIEEITIARMNRLREMRDRGEVTQDVFTREIERIRQGYESLMRTPVPVSGERPDSGRKTPNKLPS
jgi:small-conductance mechanosensitive channel